MIKMKTLNDEMTSIVQDNSSNIDINELLNGNKKLVTFLGSSKSGTSFLVNNIARILSSKGVDVALLDATQNRTSYYIYTKNVENLRKQASTCIENLAHGISNGIKVDDNLTIYTALPGENKYIQEVEPILETLIKKHSLILIDCDFNTPVGYFEYSQEFYLVQSMDVLTIQPLTEFLSKLKNKGVLNDEKLRIIINKYVKLDGITEKEIIGGMAFYNDPAMSYMQQLFNKNFARYIIIPFEQEIYIKYLEGIAKCDISLAGYSEYFKQILEQLGQNIYPFLNENNN